MRALLALLARHGPAAYARTTFDPGHVTSSAFIVARDTGRVLLHRHRRFGTWMQFGGHDEGEHDPCATALREAREESGIVDLSFVSQTPLDIDVHAIAATEREPAHLHHDVRFLFVTPVEIASSPLGVDESTDLAWLSLADAAARGDEGIRRALRKIRPLLYPA